jgi:hypothetical protein
VASSSLLAKTDSASYGGGHTTDKPAIMAGRGQILLQQPPDLGCCRSVGDYQMNSERQKRIEQRAYALWEAEGQPHGRHEEHWSRAAQQIEAEQAVAKRSSRRAAASTGSRLPRRQKKVTA